MLENLEAFTIRYRDPLKLNSIQSKQRIMLLSLINKRQPLNKSDVEKLLTIYSQNPILVENYLNKQKLQNFYDIPMNNTRIKKTNLLIILDEVLVAGGYNNKALLNLGLSLSNHLQDYKSLKFLIDNNLITIEDIRSLRKNTVLPGLLYSTIKDQQILDFFSMKEINNTNYNLLNGYNLYIGSNSMLLLNNKALSAKSYCKLIQYLLIQDDIKAFISNFYYFCNKITTTTIPPAASALILQQIEKIQHRMQPIQNDLDFNTMTKTLLTHSDFDFTLATKSITNYNELIINNPYLTNKIIAGLNTDQNYVSFINSKNLGFTLLNVSTKSNILKIHQELIREFSKEIETT